MRKNLPTLTKIGKEKPEDCVDIADKKIDEKPPNLVGTEEENRLQSFADFTIKLVLWLILIACLCHLASALTNTDDEAEDLTVHR